VHSEKYCFVLQSSFYRNITVSFFSVHWSHCYQLKLTAPPPPPPLLHTHTDALALWLAGHRCVCVISNKTLAGNCIAWDSMLLLLLLLSLSISLAALSHPFQCLIYIWMCVSAHLLIIISKLLDALSSSNKANVKSNAYTQRACTVVTMQHRTQLVLLSTCSTKWMC